MDNGIGLLWFDNTDKQLISKIHQAIDAYITRYGDKCPNLVMVNPADLPGDFPIIDGLTVKANSQVLRNHLFVGVQDG